MYTSVLIGAACNNQRVDILNTATFKCMWVFGVMTRGFGPFYYHVPGAVGRESKSETRHWPSY